MSGDPRTDNGMPLATSTGTTSGAGPASWEVFLRPLRGLAHQHVGSVRATDARLALAAARDLFTRRGRPQSLWVVRSQDVHALAPQEKAPYFAAESGKPYRYPAHFAPLGPDDTPDGTAETAGTADLTHTADTAATTPVNGAPTDLPAGGPHDH